ncbi:hypothetical protein LNI90_01745 [Tenacibaculum dicentrarchi]|uniref:hypothetical protein n=1 Tax=Tenacibaculum finnmarkense TaxID=2781243 RepID=UPI001BE675ED|nr:hypothetical protein [Tenacibaculum finnmarkense]MCD8404560.1 hypothetical protein [Tenacibaculum dicentrarchi]MCD8399020.1 hypothetical protein [Tenacibaculum finnmarkense genomovar ulcerans]MCD8406653.1 hypothetical protein [Tenacibaculum dicentrarchi]MCD8414367.1 hypothetical protein [Tenacibaculum dicentrarchi]MCD8418995.1 hypothetical protein [Tenacibaculum dicentrarchi]
MKNFILLFLNCIFLISCEDNNPQSTVIGTEVELSLSDKEGNDLLDPTNKNGIKENEIKHFYLLNGIKKEFYNSNYDSPKRIGINKINGKYRLGIGLNSIKDKNGEVISLIQWNENDTDTIKATLQTTTNTTIIINPKFNDKKIPDTETGYFLEVIK